MRVSITWIMSDTGEFVRREYLDLQEDVTVEGHITRMFRDACAERAMVQYSDGLTAIMSLQEN